MGDRFDRRFRRRPYAEKSIYNKKMVVVRVNTLLFPNYISHWLFLLFSRRIEVIGISFYIDASNVPVNITSLRFNHHHLKFLKKPGLNIRISLPSFGGGCYVK